MPSIPNPKSQRLTLLEEALTPVIKSSAYDPAFEQHLIDHGIYPEDYSDDENTKEPDNWKEINARLAQRRESLSLSRFTRQSFLNFRKLSRDALTESVVMSKSFPVITGDAKIPSQQNIKFGNLKDLTDGSLTNAQPDFYDGSRPAALRSQIRNELDSYIVPSTNKSAPCLPNFFAEVKGPKGTIPVASLQVMYYGALGARGIHELRSHVDPENTFDNNAYVITSTYHSTTGSLTMYTTHPTPCEDPSRPIEYRMTHINGWCMTGNPDSFREGATAFRNARDWAKEKRDELITAANRSMPAVSPSTVDSSTPSILSPPIEIAQVLSDTSMDGTL